MSYRMSPTDTINHIKNMIQIYDTIKEVFERELLYVFKDFDTNPHDIVKLSILLHDVGKLAQEYINTDYFDHSAEYVIKAFWENYDIDITNTNNKEIEKIKGIVSFVIKEHHEYRHANNNSSISKNISVTFLENYILTSINNLLQKNIRIIKKEQNDDNLLSKFDKKRNKTPLYCGIESIYVLNIVTFIDNLEAIKSRGNQNKTELMRILTTLYPYNVIYNQIIKEGDIVWKT